MVSENAAWVDGYNHVMRRFADRQTVRVDLDSASPQYRSGMRQAERDWVKGIRGLWLYRNSNYRWYHLDANGKLARDDSFERVWE